MVLGLHDYRMKATRLLYGLHEYTVVRIYRNKNIRE